MRLRSPPVKATIEVPQKGDAKAWSAFFEEPSPHTIAPA